MRGGSSVNTRLLGTGGIVALSVAFAVSLAGQTTPQPARAAAPAPAARPQSATPPAPVMTRTAAAPDAATQRALVDKYCVTCHNARLKTADLKLDELDMTNLAEHADVAEKVVRKMRAVLMPPTNMPRPDAATFEGLIPWMERELDKSKEQHLPAPGLHRLNRVEYANAIRDLLA